MKKFISFYYFGLLVFVLYQAALTIYSTGELLFARTKLADLKQYSSQLEESSSSTRAQHFGQLSLLELQESDVVAGYIKISKPVAIITNQNLAYDASE